MKFYFRALRPFVLVCLLSSSPALSADYKDSQDFADYVKSLTEMSNTRLTTELPQEFALAGSACGTGAGLTVGAAAFDFVPIINAPKAALGLTKVSVKIIERSAGALRISDLPIVTSMLQALTAGGEKLAKLTPEALKKALVSAAPGVGTSTVYAERVAGTLVNMKSADPKGFSENFEAIAPHAYGVGLSFIVDTLRNGLSRAMGGPSVEREWTKTASTMTRAVARMSFSNSGACAQHWMKFNAATDELMLRAGLLDRPSPEPSGNQNFTGTERNRAVSDRIHPAARRPFGGPDNGARDFAPSSGKGI